MLKNIFQKGSKFTNLTLLRKNVFSVDYLQLRYSYSTPAYHPTIQKIVSGEALANIDPILSEIARL